MSDASWAALRAVIVDDALGELPPGVQASILGLVLATAGWAYRRPTRLRVLAFVACCLLWSRANHALEGPILVTLSRSHGITTADLLPPALSGLLLARHVLHRRRSVRVDEADQAGRVVMKSPRGTQRAIR